MRLRGAIALSFLGAAFLAEAAQAGQLREFYRGARAMGMGNAYVGLADDEQAIFLNPAGLAGNQKYQFHYAVGDITTSHDTVMSGLGGLSIASGLSAETINSLMGKNIFGQAQITPTLMMPNFGLAVIIDGQVGLTAANTALPNILFGYQTTNGIQAAYGISIGRNTRSKHGFELRLGVGGKVLWRRGGYRFIETVQLFNLNQGSLTQIAGNWGFGFGGDLGSQVIYRFNNKLSVMFGLAFTNLGDVSFTEGAESIKGDLTGGLAAQYEFRGTKVTLTYDYKHILDATDWRKKNHVGLELAFPMFSIFGGVHQVYPTYGFSFDLWLFRLTAASYEVENGSYVFQNAERRYMLRAGLKFNL